MFFPLPKARFSGCTAREKRPVQQREAMSIAVRTTQENVFANTGMFGSDARFGRIAKGGHLKRRDIKNNVNMWLVFFRDFVIYSYFCISLKIRFRGTKTHTDPKTNTFANADTATAFAGAPS